MRADGRSGLHAQRLAQHVSVDRQLARIERVAAHRGERTHAQLRGAAGRSLADPGRRVVRVAQGEEVLQQVRANATDEAAHRRIGPLGPVGEHVLADQPRDARRVVARDAEPAQQALGELSPLVLMTDEVAVGQGRGLAEVVEQSGQAQEGVRTRKRVGGAERVVERVAGEALGLRHAAQRGQLRQQDPQQPQLFEAPECSGGWPRGGEQAEQLVANALAGERRRLGGVATNGGLGGRLHHEPEAGGEADGAEHAQRILGEARIGVADRPQHARLQVAAPSAGSTSVPRPAERSAGRQAMALIVKSRRARSSSSELPQRPDPGAGGRGSRPRSGRWSPPPLDRCRGGR